MPGSSQLFFSCAVSFPAFMNVHERSDLYSGGTGQTGLAPSVAKGCSCYRLATRSSLYIFPMGACH